MRDSISGFVDEAMQLELPLAEARTRLVQEFEARYIATLLERSGGNVSRAAAFAGIARRYLYMLLERYPAVRRTKVDFVHE
jgi:DNA-binding NtrC family response regulator